eukprot:gene3493-2444_t
MSLQCIVMRGGLWRWFDVCLCFRVCLGLDGLVACWVVDMNCQLIVVLMNLCITALGLVMIAVWAFIAYFVSYDAHFLFRLHVPKLWVYGLDCCFNFWDFCMFYADFVAVIVCICLILVLSLGFVQCVWGGVGFLRNFVLWEVFGEFNDYVVLSFFYGKLHKICGMIWLLRIVSYTLLLVAVLDLMMHIITEHQDEFCYFPFTCLVVNGAIAAYLFGRVCNVMLFGDEFRQIYLGITDVGDMSVVYNAGFMLGNVDFGCLIVFGWLINEFIGMLAVLGKWLLDAMRTMDVLRWFVLMRLWIFACSINLFGWFLLHSLHLFMFKFEGAFFVLIVSLYNVWVVLTAMVTSDDCMFIVIRILLSFDEVMLLIAGLSCVVVVTGLLCTCRFVFVGYNGLRVAVRRFLLRGDYVLVSGYCIYLLAVHDLDSAPYRYGIGLVVLLVVGRICVFASDYDIRKINGVLFFGFDIRLGLYVVDFRRFGGLLIIVVLIYFALPIVFRYSMLCCVKLQLVVASLRFVHSVLLVGAGVAPSCLFTGHLWRAVNTDFVDKGFFRVKCCAVMLVVGEFVWAPVSCLLGYLYLRKGAVALYCARTAVCFIVWFCMSRLDAH